MKKIIFTPLSICLLLLLILSGLVAINGLFINNEGGNSLGGGIALIFSLIVLGTLIFEQSIVKGFRQSIKKIWVIELIILAVIVLYLIISGFELSYG